MQEGSHRSSELSEDESSFEDSIEQDKPYLRHDNWVARGEDFTQVDLVGRTNSKLPATSAQTPARVSLRDPP